MTNDKGQANPKSKIPNQKLAMSDDFIDQLETFENQHPGRDYEIEIVCPEFT